MRHRMAQMLTLLVFLGALVAVRHAFDPSVAAGPRAAYFPDVLLTDQDGKPVRFYRDLIRGKTVIINFIYTHCDGICPGTTTNLVKVQQALGARVGRDVFMYSLTLDPARDTPAVLKAYAEAYGVKPGWQFLTGAPADLERLRRRLGLVDLDPKVDRVRSQHLGMVIVGNEALDRWCAEPSLGNPRQIVTAVGWMKPRGKSVWRKSVTLAADPGLNPASPPKEPR
jgi:protein SCO1